MIPPARPEANPLLRILERRGAETLEFPALKTVPPADYGVMDRAIYRIDDFDYIIFSGSNCVIHFLERLEVLQVGKAALGELKIVAIGHGAVSALHKEGIEIHHVPKLHTAEGVTAGMGEVSGSMLMLVRVEGASRDLPRRLRDMGAEVTEVVGYRMFVNATEAMAERAFGYRLDALALANPTAVRLFFKGADQVNLNLEDLLKEVTIAAVGPATAKAARKYRLTPHIVSKGHIADLAASLREYFGEVKES